ncbi:MAG: cytidine deaminase [Verrucomicrobia bacterium]|nr:cytidine deaminase [Verrucomicrobiota bacterium]
MDDTTFVTLLKKAVEASKQSYAPYSKFSVGSCVLMEDGTQYTGCNVENASYGLTLCAERNAITTAVARGQRKIVAVAIVADGSTPPYPCGACRQVINEFGSPETIIVVATVEHPEQFDKTTLGELLPNAFGPDSL